MREPNNWPFHPRWVGATGPTKDEQIAQLRAEVERLKKALQHIADDASATYDAISNFGGPEISTGQFARLEAARAALGKGAA